MKNFQSAPLLHGIKQRLLNPPLLTTFATLLVPCLPTRIKREYGVNPQLSRSCKLHNGIQIIATVCKDGKVGCPEVSQKTCQVL